MLPLKRSVRFVVLLVAVYGLLIFPWPELTAVYAATYRYVCNGLFASMGSAAEVRFEPLAGNPRFDSIALLSCKGYDGVRSKRNVPFHTRKTGYLPTALMIALILATPQSLKTAVKRLAIGLAAIHVFIAVGVLVTLLYSLTDQRPEQNIKPVLDVSMYTSRAIFFFYRMMVISPTLSFVAPVLIWIGLTLPDAMRARNVSREPSKLTARARRDVKRHGRAPS